MKRKHHVLHIMSNEWRKTCKTPIQMILMIIVPLVTILFLFWGLDYIRSATSEYDGRIYCQDEAQREMLSELVEKYDSFEIVVGDEEQAGQKIRNGKVDVAVVMCDQSIDIIYDSNLLSSSETIQEASTLASEIAIYTEGEEVFQQYLSFMPEVVTEDASTDEEKLDSGLAQIAGTMGMILFLSMASNAMTLSTRSITGEKERQTFDTLVLCPTSLREVLLGKIIVMNFQIFLAGLMGGLGMFFGMYFWDHETFRLVADQVGGDAWWIVIILLILFSASMLITGVFAIIGSAFPEAKKTALFGSLGMIVISFAAMAPSYFNTKFLEYVPIANFSLVLTNTCKHNFDMMPILSGFGISILVIVLCAVLATRLWERSHE